MNLSQQVIESYKKNDELSALRVKWLRRSASEATDFSELYCLYEITLNLIDKYPTKLNLLKSIGRSIKLKLSDNKPD